jgi:hypothetical protein
VSELTTYVPVPTSCSVCQNTVANTTPRTTSRHVNFTAVITLNTMRMSPKFAAREPTSKSLAETSLRLGESALSVSAGERHASRRSGDSATSPWTIGSWNVGFVSTSARRGLVDTRRVQQTKLGTTSGTAVEGQEQAAAQVALTPSETICGGSGDPVPTANRPRYEGI